MKKIIFAVLVFLFFIIIFLVSTNKNKAEENIVENIEENVIENSADENVSETIVVELEDEKEYSLEGKTIAFIGDSLIEGYGNDYKGIDYYLKEQLPNTNFINNSKSGSTVTDNSGDDNIVMINQAKTLTGDDPDIIMFDGGANDIIGYDLDFLNKDLEKDIGSIDMSTENITETDSVINDFEEIIVELKNRFPNAKLYYVQPFLLDDETIDNLTNDDTAKKEIKSRYDNLLEEIKKMCSKWNILFLDTAEKFSGTGLQYRQEDWIHINEDGYKLISSEILKELKNIKEN